MFASWRLLTLLAACSLSGCGSREATINEPKEAREYALLPRTSQTHNRELQAELARLEAEGATPFLLGMPEPSHGEPQTRKLGSAIGLWVFIRTS
ncbi:MAG: hypothetical protein CMJ64_20825 [Planctomycetaceae bacterium]|nr:hypothetical protein [Planctomycetaceae bacterium]